MNVEIFAEWLRRQGHTIIHTPSSYWYDAGPKVLQAFPFDWLIQPSKDELRDLIYKRGNIAARYSQPFDSVDGIVSYHVVLSGLYSIEKLRPQARNGIRRGLQYCQVEQISFERLAKEGWILQQDTLERQGRTRCMSQSQWECICLSAQDLPGFEAWAAIVDGELAATMIISRIGDTYYVPYAQCYRKYLCVHANQALFYTASCEMLKRDGVRKIFFSLHSLDAPESVNEFKFRMGIMLKPVRQKIIFNPVIQPFATPLAHNLFTQLLKLDPHNPLVTKGEGMLRFYLQGKQPLAEQPCPKFMTEYLTKIRGIPACEGQNKELFVHIQE
jgi:hypothetical protein